MSLEESINQTIKEFFGKFKNYPNIPPVEEWEGVGKIIPWEQVGFYETSRSNGHRAISSLVKYIQGQIIRAEAEEALTSPCTYVREYREWYDSTISCKSSR